MDSLRPIVNPDDFPGQKVHSKQSVDAAANTNTAGVGTEIEGEQGTRPRDAGGKSTDELIRLFDKQILPESKEAFDLILTGSSAGTDSYVDVLDGWRSWLGFQFQRATNQAQLGKALAALKSATGEGP